MNAQEYVDQRLDDQIRWYDTKSLVQQRWFKRLRLVEIAAAATIPLLAGFLDAERPLLPIVVGLLGATVAIVAGALGLYQFEHQWIKYRTTCESLKKEKFFFLTASAPFDGDPSESFQLLVQRVEALISTENTTWAQHMTKPRQAENDGEAMG
ncbi:MAG TPA: DUF4231 domain-containing protein [Longimicrobiales bacterium]|nr:DUF4231 domain-containing protein [Longimicrobiales bacterium]